jgi:hypothetical protein
MPEKPTVDDVRRLEAFIASTGTPEHLLTFQGVLRSHEELYAASQDVEYGWAGDGQATDA